MSKHKQWVLLLMTCLAVSFATETSAATSWKRLGANPFYRPPLSSEADLRNMVKERSVDLKTGFTKAGYPELYPAFMEQFPTAKIDSVTIAPGDTFTWIVFKNKATGKVAVLKDATWRGPVAFDAYHFAIDKDGKRHDFVVPYACGNIALRTVAAIPPKPAAVAAPAPAPPAPAAPPPPAPAPAPVPAPRPLAVAAPPVAAAAPAPAPVAPAPVAPKPAAPTPVVVPPPPPAAMWRGGLLFDVGLSRQFDPANYLFARVGYEVPLFDKLYLMGLVGGSLRWMGNDGGNAFTADVMLDYHWLGRHSVGLGAGFWSGNDGQVDLLADVGYLLFGDPDGNNGSLFLEARLPADELGSVNEFGRLGLGLRFRF
ncbi:MAG: hypothetical protein ACYC99_06945 [Candidatus Geothermincolia bacterium]